MVGRFAQAWNYPKCSGGTRVLKVGGARGGGGASEGKALCGGRRRGKGWASGKHLCGGEKGQAGARPCGGGQVGSRALQGEGKGQAGGGGGGSALCRGANGTKPCTRGGGSRQLISKKIWWGGGGMCPHTLLHHHCPNDVQLHSLLVRFNLCIVHSDKSSKEIFIKVACLSASHTKIFQVSVNCFARLFFQSAIITVKITSLILMYYNNYYCITITRAIVFMAEGW